MILMTKDSNKTAPKWHRINYIGKAIMRGITFQGVNIKDCITDEDQRLTLAYESLEEIPRMLVDSFGNFVRTLDLSHNKFRNVKFLEKFENLTSLILDHNDIDSSTVFPFLPQLQILWLNHNSVEQLFPFIQNLYNSFPRLQHLSLMGNAAAPMCIGDSTFYQNLQYRLFIISWFPELNHLDDRPVTADERDEAVRLYKRPLIERISQQESVQKVFRALTSGLKDWISSPRVDGNSRRSNFV